MVRLMCVVLSLVCAAAATGQPSPPDRPRPLWGDLAPGDHGVGFRSFWSLDHGRTYTRPESGLPASEKFPRPVLVNIWYPAARTDAAPMPHGTYLDIAPSDERLDQLAADLAAYALDVISEESLRAPIEDLDPEARAPLDALLATPTAAVREAPPAAGAFPLVLYHAGYGSSFEDNAVLCEFLASHGYVVVGSAFLEGDGGSFNIDAERDSEEDLEYLIRLARETLRIDWHRVAMVGHSGGAHTAVRFISRTSSPLDAMVSLDTTQDYHSFSDHRWDDMVPGALDSAEEVDIPLMFAARQHALFRMADRLTASRRTYITLADLEHNSFISQGVFAAEMTEDPKAAAVRSGYSELCRAVRLFLDSELMGSESAQSTLATRWAGSAPGASPVFLERVAAGESVPEYDDESGLPPTPRQMAAMLDRGESARAGALLVRFRDDPRARPFAETEFAVSVVFQLVHEDRASEAAAMLDSFATERSEILRILGALESMYSRIGATRLAEPYAEVVRALTEEPGQGPP